jgi:uncharacterized protein (TIGR02466 family)
MQSGAPAQALAVCEEFLARHPGERLVLARHAYLLLEVGRTAEAGVLLDLAGLVRVTDVPGLPDGALAELIESHPSLLESPANKSTHGGGQTGELEPSDHPPLAPLHAAITAAVAAFAAGLAASGRAAHPAMAWARRSWTLRLWGTALRAGGFQSPHVHPLGWLSGVYYARVPPRMSGTAEAGWLEFGSPPQRYGVRAPVATRAVEPRPGRLVLFPSYFYHRTLPFFGDGTRVSIAFDVVPLPS